MDAQYLSKTFSLTSSIFNSVTLHSIRMTDASAEYLAQMLKSNITLTYPKLKSNRIDNWRVQVWFDALTYQNNSSK